MNNYLERMSTAGSDTLSMGSSSKGGYLGDDLPQVGSFISTDDHQSDKKMNNSVVIQQEIENTEITIEETKLNLTMDQKDLQGQLYQEINKWYS